MSTQPAPQQQLLPTDDFPQLLTELAEVIARTLRDVDLPEDRAAAVAATAIDHVIDLFGGQVIYLPKAARSKTHRRWQEIWDKFTGHNHAQLAKEFGMGVHNIYKVIATMRALNAKRLYGGQDLFSGDEPAK
jgi:Mor family transcriptional regulator